MALIFKTHNGSNYYPHVPHAAVEIRVEPVHSSDSNEVFEFKHIWTITGIIVPGGITIQEQIAGLHAAYDLGTLQSAQILDDTTPLETLPTDGGIKITSFEFPEGKGPEWATKRQYKIVLEGLDHTSTVDSAGEYTYTITYSTDQSSIQTRTISGTLKDIKGKAATTKYGTLKSNQSWAVWSGANLITDSESANKDDTICTFTVVHRKYWIIYPGGITNGDVNIEKSTDSQNIERYRAFGWFEGTEAVCLSAINALVPGSAIRLTSSSTRKGYANRTSFSLEYIYRSGNDILFFQENLSIAPSIPDFVFKRVLGFHAIKQYTSYTVARAIQTGVIKKLEQYPLSPQCHWPEVHLKHSEITRIEPEYNSSSGKFVYGLVYTYVFEFATTPTW